MAVRLDAIRLHISQALHHIEDAAVLAGHQVVVIGKATPGKAAEGASYVMRSTGYMLSSTPSNLEKIFKLGANVLDLGGYSSTATYTKVVIDTICARNITDIGMKFRTGYNRMTRADVVKFASLGVAGICETGKWLQTYAKVDLAGIAASFGQTRLMLAVGGDKVISFAVQFSLVVTKNACVIFASSISIGQTVYSVYTNGSITKKEILELAVSSLKIGVIITSGGAGILFVAYTVDVASTAFKASAFTLNFLTYVKAVYDAPANAF